jgi:uncharacterized protein YkwD
MHHPALVSLLATLRPLALAGCAAFSAGAPAQVSLEQGNPPPLLRSQRQTQPDAEPGKGGYVVDDRKPLPPEVQATLSQINTYRAAGATCGSQRFEPAAPLAWSEQLQTAATRHAEDMAQRRTMSHTGGDGSDVGTRTNRVGYAWWGVGENVSAGYRSGPEALVGWMNSPGHCANMMSAGYTEVGVGAAHASGDAFGWYRAMVLAKGRGKP